MKLIAILLIKQNLQTCHIFTTSLGGLPPQTSDKELTSFFSQYGVIKDCKIINDRAGISRGYGFLTFESEDVASSLVEDVSFHVFLVHTILSGCKTAARILCIKIFAKRHEANLFSIFIYFNDVERHASFWVPLLALLAPLRL